MRAGKMCVCRHIQFMIGPIFTLLRTLSDGVAGMSVPCVIAGLTNHLRFSHAGAPSNSSMRMGKRGIEPNIHRVCELGGSQRVTDCVRRKSG